MCLDIFLSVKGLKALSTRRTYIDVKIGDHCCPHSYSAQPILGSATATMAAHTLALNWPSRSEMSCETEVVCLGRGRLA